MIFVFSLVIILAAFAFVAYPLIRPSREEAVEDAELEEELLFRRDSTYSALKELEFDYGLGNLSPQDHHELEEKYKEKAIGILKEIDGLKAETPEKKTPVVKTLDEIERQVMLHRKRKVKNLEEEIMSARKKGKPRLVCPSCNRKVQVQSKYCPSCGDELYLLCFSCGKAVERSDKFCAECGTELAQG